MIKLIAIGNLGRDCTTNSVNGKSVINFSVAHTEKFKDSNTGETKSKATWIECAYWTDKTAIAQYLKKGTTVYVERTPDVRIFQTSDGTNKPSLTLRVVNVQLLGNRQEGQQDAPSHTQPASTLQPQRTSVPAEASFAEEQDDIPF